MSVLVITNCSGVNLFPMPAIQKKKRKENEILVPNFKDSDLPEDAHLESQQPRSVFKVNFAEDAVG